MSQDGFLMRGMIMACLSGRQVSCKNEQLTRWRTWRASTCKDSDKARKLIGSGELSMVTLRAFGGNDISIEPRKEAAMGKWNNERKIFVIDGGHQTKAMNFMRRGKT